MLTATEARYPMGLLLFLACFAAAYAVVMVLGDWVAVSALGWGDPKFGDAAANLRMMRQILPLIVAVATLSAFVGARTRQERLQRGWATASAAGSGAGALAAAAFFVMVAMFEAARRVLPEPPATVLLLALRMLDLAVPAVVAHAVIGFTRRNVTER